MQGFNYRQCEEVELTALRLYGLLLRVLERIRDSPCDAKLRSISATAKSLRSDVLEAALAASVSRIARTRFSGVPTSRRHNIVARVAR